MKWALKEGIGLETLSPFARKLEANWSVDVCGVVAECSDGYVCSPHEHHRLLIHLISSIPGTLLMLRRHFSLLSPLILLSLSLYLQFATYTPQGMFHTLLVINPVSALNYYNFYYILTKFWNLTNGNYWVCSMFFLLC